MKITEFILELFYPRRAECMGCGSRIGMDSRDVCPECRMRMAKNWVGVRMPERDMKISNAAYAYRYASPAGGMVRKLKYSGVRLLADEMGRDVARAAELMHVNDALATFVPMHPRRERRRGLNHSELLARKVAEQMGLECMKLLARTRNAPQQARLSREERLVNLKDAFCVPKDMRQMVVGRNILLIDDVSTTGATAKSCAEALLDAGAAKVYFAAYAYGEGS